MTDKQIIELAKQAGFVEYELDDGTTNAFDKRYEAFAKLVAQHEREACAKVCDEHPGYMTGIVSLKIRARGES